MVPDVHVHHNIPVATKVSVLHVGWRSRDASVRIQGCVSYLNMHYVLINCGAFLVCINDLCVCVCVRLIVL